MPLLQKIRRVVFDQSFDGSYFSRLKPVVRGKHAGRQPKLALGIIPLNVNVRWFIGIAGEEKEPVGTRTKHRWH
jgi:hypothetical protein